MPLALATADGSYLGHDQAGAWIRTPYPVNAELWEDARALLAWLDGLTAEQLTLLDARGARPVLVHLDLAGCRPDDATPPPAAPERPAQRRQRELIPGR